MTFPLNPWRVRLRTPFRTLFEHVFSNQSSPKRQINKLMLACEKVDVAGIKVHVAGIKVDVS